MRIEGVDRVKRIAYITIFPTHFGPIYCPRCAEFGESTRWFDIGDSSIGTINITHKCRRCNWTFHIVVENLPLDNKEKS